MVCKQFTVKQQRVVFACLIAAGILCLLAAFLAPVSDRGQGILCGAATAVLVIGAVRSVQLWRLSRDPERVRDYELSQNEERTAFIVSQAMMHTLVVSLVVEYAMGIAALIAGQNLLGTVLCWLVVGQTLLWLLLRTLYQKKY